MISETPVAKTTPVATSSHAVFVSYASEDAEAAQHIAEALGAAGIEVWFDKSELRGGDAWDRRIREQIHDCRLFIAVISAHTEGRDEGYFRREWRLAVDRTHDMDERRAFLVPVVIDATSERGAHVPEKFHELQWTRLPGGETTSAFVDRILRLLVPPESSATAAIAPVFAGPNTVQTLRKLVPRPWRSRPVIWTIRAVLAVGLAYFVADRFWIAKQSKTTPATEKSASGMSVRTTTADAFSPPPHSIAVLPFVNMSGDKDQEYFSEGLTEELLNSLSRINELQVAARTSSFSFQGEHPDIATVAHKLNVGAVLEGSVRRSSHTLRVTTQLVNGVTGFDLWSETYDRDLGDVLKLQTEIATAVASALKVTLLGDEAAKIELGGTRNPAAFDAYLRGAKASNSFSDIQDLPAAIAAYTEAIRLDPHYSLAFVGRSIAFTWAAEAAKTLASVREDFDKAQTDARQALALAPDLAHAHLALGLVSEGNLDFTQASEAYERALALAPGNAEVLRNSGLFAAFMGHFDAGVAATRRAVVLDPLARESHYLLGLALYFARRYDEAVAAFAEVISLDPDFKGTYGWRGLAYYGLGDLQSARASCETKPDYWLSHQCLAVIYDKLGRHADAEAELSKVKAAFGDAEAYQCSTIYAQWGNGVQALKSLETTLRQRDPGLENLKTDPLLDPLRKEPRFQAIERALRFPD